MTEQKNVRMRPGLVLGLGCERGADPADVLSLAKRALERCGRSAAEVMLIASLDARADEPAIVEAARHFGAPFQFFSAPDLEALTPRLANPSDLVFAYTGCHGVAEAAALAGGGERAVLIVPKLKSRQATVAIVESFQDFVGGGSEVESVCSQTESTGTFLPVVGLLRQSPPSPQRGEVPSAGEAKRGALPRIQSPPSPSSAAARHLLPAGEKREFAAGSPATTLLPAGAC